MEKGSHVDVLLNIHSILIVLGSQFHAFDISIVVVVGNHQYLFRIHNLGSKIVQTPDRSTTGVYSYFVFYMIWCE